MRRVWAAVLAVWSTVAIVAVLAWTQPPVRSYAVQGTPAVVVVRGRGGVKQLARVVLLPAGTGAQTTSGPSAVASPGTGVQLVSAQPQVVTHSS
jgi:hypothetical protein